ncbi:hypothetical protein PG985_014263 [Apiospora marii]|uniref:uncharacterized protein n=1 Tax=Apiospora marii TaxID=335849 RepID=UPI0031321353
MQLHPFLEAGFGAVVAAAPSPIFISSPILTPQTCDNNVALLVLRGLDDAAAICSQLSPASTQTALNTATLTQTSTETVTTSVTSTDAQRATVTVTTVAQTTEITIVDGPTDISTNTIT